MQSLYDQKLLSVSDGLISVSTDYRLGWSRQDQKAFRHFDLVDSKEQEFDLVFRYWIIKAAQMLVEDQVNSAVNRLVFCIQSDKQGIGKTTFARALTKPFDESLNPSVYEMDRPDFTKDSQLK